MGPRWGKKMEHRARETAAPGCNASRVHTSDKAPQNPEKWVKVDSRAQPCAKGGFQLSFYALFCPQEGPSSHPCPVPHTFHLFSTRRSYPSFPAEGEIGSLVPPPGRLCWLVLPALTWNLRKRSITDPCIQKSTFIFSLSFTDQDKACLGGASVGTHAAPAEDWPH